MTRSVWKGPFVDSHLLKKVKAASDSGGNSVIKTWSRRSTILPEFVGVNFAVHNGKRFIPVNVLRTWLAINLESSLLQELLMATQVIRKQSKYETTCKKR